MELGRPTIGVRSGGWAGWRFLFLHATVLVCVFLSSCQKSSSSTPDDGQRSVAVAAASDLKFALEDVLVGFRTKHPDIRVETTYGSSGNFFAQLQNRAPFDVFFSADMTYPMRLIEGGHARRGSEFMYAHGRLVLWAPADSKVDVEKLGMQALVEPEVRKVAIANPQHAPYGRAAEAAMKKAGLYDRVQSKLVLGENIAQTAQFVESGSVDLGLIALSLALSAPMKGKGRYWEVPEYMHPTLEQAGVILTWAKDLGAAEELRAFVMSPEGRSVLERYGFVIPN